MKTFKHILVGILLLVQPVWQPVWAGGGSEADNGTNNHQNSRKALPNGPMAKLETLERLYRLQLPDDIRRAIGYEFINSEYYLADRNEGSGVIFPTGSTDPNQGEIKLKLASTLFYPLSPITYYPLLVEKNDIETTVWANIHECFHHRTELSPINTDNDSVEYIIDLLKEDWRVQNEEPQKINESRETLRKFFSRYWKAQDEDIYKRYISYTEKIIEASDDWRFITEQNLAYIIYANIRMKSLVHHLVRLALELDPVGFKDLKEEGVFSSLLNTHELHPVPMYRTTSYGFLNFRSKEVLEGIMLCPWGYESGLYRLLDRFGIFGVSRTFLHQMIEGNKNVLPVDIPERYGVSDEIFRMEKLITAFAFTFPHIKNKKETIKLKESQALPLVSVLKVPLLLVPSSHLYFLNTKVDFAYDPRIPHSEANELLPDLQSLTPLSLTTFLWDLASPEFRVSRSGVEGFDIILRGVIALLKDFFPENEDKAKVTPFVSFDSLMYQDYLWLALGVAYSPKVSQKIYDYEQMLFAQYPKEIK